jgi:hypothetical protein
MSLGSKGKRWNVVRIGLGWRLVTAGSRDMDSLSESESES